MAKKDQASGSPAPHRLQYLQSAAPSPSSGIRLRTSKTRRTQLDGFREAVAGLAARAVPRARCAVVIESIAACSDEHLFADEAVAINDAVSQRRATFRAGRACARAALRQYGLERMPIPMAASGAPIWPVGYTGSIAHTSKIAIALAAKSPPLQSLGVDLETDEPLDSETTLQVVCRPEEISRLRSLQHGGLSRGKLIFVIKEAIYKLYYPVINQFLDFQNVDVLIDDRSEEFYATILNGETRKLLSASGGFVQTEGLIVAITSM